MSPWIGWPAGAHGRELGVGGARRCAVQCTRQGAAQERTAGHRCDVVPGGHDGVGGGCHTRGVRVIQQEHRDRGDREVRGDRVDHLLQGVGLGGADRRDDHAVHHVELAGGLLRLGQCRAGGLGGVPGLPLGRAGKVHHAGQRGGEADRQADAEQGVQRLDPVADQGPQPLPDDLGGDADPDADPPGPHPLQAEEGEQQQEQDHRVPGVLVGTERDEQAEDHRVGPAQHGRQARPGGVERRQRQRRHPEQHQGRPADRDRDLEPGVAVDDLAEQREDQADARGQPTPPQCAFRRRRGPAAWCVHADPLSCSPQRRVRSRRAHGATRPAGRPRRPPGGHDVLATLGHHRPDPATTPDARGPTVFDALSERLDAALAKVKGRGRLDEKTVDATLKEIRLALLEADVNFKVVKEFVGHLREALVGEDVSKALNPSQQVIKAVHAEIVRALGGAVGAAGPRQPEAGGDHARRPAGLRQDHRRRQARRAAEEEGPHPDAGGLRPAAPRRRPAAARQRREGRRPRLRPGRVRRPRAGRARLARQGAPRPAATS